MTDLKDKVLSPAIVAVAIGFAAFFFSGVLAVTHLVAQPTTVWRGGTPDSAAVKASVSVGSTPANASNSYEWSLPGATYTLVAALTPAQQEQGLGGVSALEPDSGMFFVFPVSGNYGFWMKDMTIPLDIIWLDQDFKIVHIEADLSPATYPQIYYPNSASRYVIEVAAGTAANYGLQEGQTMQIYQN